MSPGTIRLLILFFLLFMVAFSFLPVPGTTLIMLYVVLFRPRWFKRLVDAIYHDVTASQAPALADPKEENGESRQEDSA